MSDFNETSSIGKTKVCSLKIYNKLKFDPLPKQAWFCHGTSQLCKKSQKLWGRGGRGKTPQVFSSESPFWGLHRSTVVSIVRVTFVKSFMIQYWKWCIVICTNWTLFCPLLFCTMKVLILKPKWWNFKAFWANWQLSLLTRSQTQTLKANFSIS